MARRIFILGAGRFGTHLGARLSEFGCKVAHADKDAERVEHLTQEGFHAVEMDAEDKNALKEAGVQEADAVVVSIGENMQGSILTTLLLNELKVKKLICRALDDKHAFEPAPGLKMATRDSLFVAGRRENINKFERECGPAE